MGHLLRVKSMIYVLHPQKIQHSKFEQSTPPSAVCMPQWTGSALVQVMAYHLFSTKPLPEPMLAYCQLRLLGANFSEILIEIPEMPTFNFQNSSWFWDSIKKMLNIWWNGKESSKLLLNFPDFFFAYFKQKWRFQGLKWAMIKQNE